MPPRFQDLYIDEIAALTGWPEREVDEVARKRAKFRELREGPYYRRRKLALDLWTAAFFWPLKDPEEWAPTHGAYLDLIEGRFAPPEAAEQQIETLAKENRFFHWGLEFPDIFRSGGFDCVLGNPPWERIKLQEQEFFAERDPEIAAAPNKTARERMIAALPKLKPGLAEGFGQAKRAAEGALKSARHSQRFALSAVGDLNTFALFAELASALVAPQGRAGIIVPTAVATGKPTKLLFRSFTAAGSLVSLVDFLEARDFFLDLESREPFCLLTLRGPQRSAQIQAGYVFQLLKIEESRHPQRRIRLRTDDFALLNPNTGTCPKFRTQADLDLARTVYRTTGVLVREEPRDNPWGVKYRQGLFHSSGDNALFSPNTRDAMCGRRFHLSGNVFERDGIRYSPLYEPKMAHQYDHRFGSYTAETVLPLSAGAGLPTPRPAEYADPTFVPLPRYWVAEQDLEAKLATWPGPWIIAFRDMVRQNDEHTSITTMLPRYGVIDQFGILFPEGLRDARLACCLLATTNSLPFDYLARQKVGSGHFKKYHIYQLPVAPPDAYSGAEVTFVASRVLQLTYTAWDMEPFARDMGDDGPPFVWDEDRRAHLRAQLDAFYFHKYGLHRKQVRYVLDPRDLTDRELEDILDPAEDPPDAPRTKDFPGETFRVLKDNEIRKFGEYRTQRLVLHYYDAWARGDRAEFDRWLPGPRHPLRTDRPTRATRT